MKKQFCMSLAALVLASSFAGCGKAALTPGATIAQEPIQSLTEAAVETTTEPEITYEVPARFQGDWTGIDDTFTVHADGEIEIPDISRLCTATLQSRPFNQADADSMLAVFMQGNPLYKEQGPTKQRYQALLEHYEAIARGEIPYEHDGTIDRVPEIIARLKEDIKTAPDEGERFLAEPQFHRPELPKGSIGGDDSWEIGGWAEVDGRNIHTLIYNWGTESDSMARFWQEGYGNANGSHGTVHGWEMLPDEPITLAFSEEKAREMGDGLMKALKLDTFTLDLILPESFRVEDPDGSIHDREIPEYGYSLRYVRTVNGLPLTRTNFYGTASDEVNPAVGTFGYEYIRVDVNEGGVVYFSWESPYTEPTVQETGVAILPFEEIQEIFGKMYFMKNDRWYKINQINGFPTMHDVNIDKVQLTLMRVRDPHTFGPAKIVPVWDFWGTDDWWYQGEEDLGDPPRYEVLMTINAMDGSLLDREIGY